MTVEIETVKYNKPDIPDIWEYDKSVEAVQQKVFSWKFMSKEIAEEFYIARTKLSKPGRNWEKIPSKNWDQYCNETVGKTKRTVNGWLKQWFEAPHISHNSVENEWYTPQKYIEAARLTMGSIDTDPATSETANQNVKAEWIYTKETNGLDKPWIGNVWLNPPYEAKIIKEFSEAVINKKNEFNQACILINNATETGWFQNMIKISNAICLVKSRIKFLDVDNEPKNAPLQGQIILYIGNNTNEFINQFNKIGICLTV